MIRPVSQRRFLFAAMACAAACLATTSAHAQTVTNHVVTSDVEFNQAIEAINADPTGNHQITLTTDITLSAQPQAIQLSGGSLTVVGNNHAIDGNAQFRPFFISGGEVALENLSLAGGLAQGGNGADGGGGGLGAGAAVFVDAGGALRLKNVAFLGNQAIGGAGGAMGTGGGGGGGLGGDGGAGHMAGSGGGGGLYGNGGAASLLAGGGGGGQLGNGGDGGSQEGGGGGGLTQNGGDGTTGGGSGGGSEGGAGGAAITSGSDAAATSGGGGGGGELGAGGNGALFGGGGGGGVARDGGSGGDFGGGGGAAMGTGGNGGFGGGGGFGDFQGGNGGFGAGGGGSNASSSGTAGIGGFGGGAGGVGGTISSSVPGGGGGGAGFGGALFVASGAEIIIEGGVTFSANTATGGTSLGDGGSGSSDGNDLFVMSATQVIFDIDLNDSLNFAPAVGNDDGDNYGVELVKEGEGTLVLSGTNPWVSTTYLDRGTLIVNGALGSFDLLNNRISLLEVDDFATLAGSGTLRGYVNNYGRVSPGTGVGDIATLTVDGAYMQGSEGVYEVDINAAGQSDLIDVTFSAWLTCGCGPDGGDLVIRAAPGTYVSGQRYTIVTTDFGIFDTFGQVTTQGLPYFWTVLLEYDVFNAYLVLNENGLAGVARTYNQYQTSVAVMNQSTTTDPSLGAVFTAMTGMNDDGKRAALDQLGGSVFGSLASFGFQSTAAYLGSVADRLRPAGGMTSAGGAGLAAAQTLQALEDPFAAGAEIQLASFEQRVPSRATGASSAPIVNTAAPNASRRAATEHYGWVGGYGLGGDATGDGNAQGFNYGVGGTSLGVDRRLGDDLLVGLAGGYAGSHLRTDGGLQSAKVDSLQTAVYFNKSLDRGYFFGVAGYGYDMYDTTRQLPANITASGEYSGNQFSTYFERGTTRRLGRWSVQPFANLQYILLQQDGFTETGAGGAGLTVDGSVNNSLRPGLGLRLARPARLGRVVVVPDVHARYAYELLDCDRLVTSSFAGAVGGGFVTAGNQLGRHFGQYGLGLNAAFTRRFGGYLGYDLLTADRTVSHTGSGGLQLAW